MRRLLATTRDPGATLARLVAGLVMFPHGSQKLLALFGGPGWSGEMAALHGGLGIPVPLVALAILTEFFGALALVLGLGARLAATAVAVLMIVAVALGGHAANGFFMNWFGTQKGEGFEYHLLMLGLCGIVLLKGAGAWSLDGLLTRRDPAPGPSARTTLAA